LLLNDEDSAELDRLREEHENAMCRSTAAEREAAELWQRIRQLLAKADQNWRECLQEFEQEFETGSAATKYWSH
jgi:hypothetical protein